MQEIQLRHFAELAKSCSYPEELLLDTLRNLSERLPDEALAVARTITAGESTQTVIDTLVDKLTAQCRHTTRRFETTN